MYTKQNSAHFSSTHRPSQLPYDPDQALVQAQAHHFDAGILYLMERLRLHHVLLHYHMEHNNHDAIIAQCKKSGFF